MSDEIVEEPFASAASQVEAAANDAAAELKSKVAKAKSDALKKIKA